MSNTGDPNVPQAESDDDDDEAGEDRDADDVRRQQVARELDSLVREAQRTGKCVGQRGLADAGNILDQQVSTGDEADEDALEHLVLAGDHALDLDERLLEARP